MQKVILVLLAMFLAVPSYGGRQFGTSATDKDAISDTGALDITGCCLTISVWVYPNTVTAGAGKFGFKILAKNPDNSHRQYYLNIEDTGDFGSNSIAAGGGNGGSSWNGQANCGSHLVTNTWQHILSEYSTNTSVQDIYYNGVKCIIGGNGNSGVAISSNGPEPDMSGNKNNGTLTGTSAAPHCPCSQPYH